jgi:hypothetical protein
MDFEHKRRVAKLYENIQVKVLTFFAVEAVKDTKLEIFKLTFIFVNVALLDIDCCSFPSLTDNVSLL